MASSGRIKRIHFIEYNAKLNTLGAGKVFPKYGTPLLATILKDRGYDVRIYLDGVSDMRFETLAACDLVCMPLFVPAYNKVKAFTVALRAHDSSIPIIIGGPHAMLYPDSVVDLCDYTVRCEGDEVLPELVDCLSTGGDPEEVRGISFQRDGEQVVTPDRAPPAIPNTIPDMMLIDGLDRVLAGPRRFSAVQNTLQTSRGCNYKCRFCPTPKLFANSYRNRDIDSVIAEIRHKRRYSEMFFVVDNNFFGDRDRSVELLRRIAAEDLGASFMLFGRQETGHDPELLQLMKRAGVKCVIVGVESLEDATLKALDKGQSRRDVVKSIENIKQSGIHVIATFAFGSEGDDEAMADQMVEFARTTGVALNVFILHDTEMEETRNPLVELERRFYTHHLRTAPDDTSFFDYATGSFATYFPKHMKPSTLQRLYLGIYKKLYTDAYILRNVFNPSAFESMFGINHGYSVRRLNEAIERVVEGYYMDYLLQVEDGLYDDNERLQEDALAQIEGLPPPRPLQEHVDRDSYELIMNVAAAPALVRYALGKVRRKLGARARRAWS